MGIRGRIGPGRDAGVGGKPFLNLFAPFVVRRAGKQAAALASEGQRIGDRLGPAAPARLERPAERPPFELHPDAPFERIEMLVEAVARREPQLGLNAMKQPVEHHSLAVIVSLVREHIQGPAEPPQAAPGDGAVRETRKAGWLPLRFRLACGTRSGRLVNDHHRTTERHTPQPAGVSLAELGGFLEPSLGELWLDLCIRSRCRAKQRERQQSVEMVPNLHRPLPLRRFPNPQDLAAGTSR